MFICIQNTSIAMSVKHYVVTSLLWIEKKYEQTQDMIDLYPSGSTTILTTIKIKY